MDLKHNFLLAMPQFNGDYFANALTYIYEHNSQGAMGIIVNRPSNISLIELMSDLGLTTNQAFAQTLVLEGGPVSTHQGFVLHSTDTPGNNIILSTALEILKAIASDKGPEHYLVALGYAGWGAGQLEEEIRSNVWLTVPANPEILFEVPYEQRIDQAAGTLGIDMRLIVTKPGHA